MGRQPRVHNPGGFYHVIARGNNRERIFFEECDRELLVELLLEGMELYGHRIHAFCLMTNHMHLALHVLEEPVSKIAHNLCFRYARRVNKRLGRTGHLFERRHRSISVTSDAQLVGLLRYIHLNPVNAGLVEVPEAYRWSSHLDYLGHPRHDWICTDACLGLLGRSPATAREVYRRLMDAPDEETFEHFLPESGKSGSPSREWRIMTDGGRESARPSLTTVDDIIATISENTGHSPELLRGPSRTRPVSRARALAAVLARETAGVTVSALAEALGREPSTLSGAASRLLQRCRLDDHEQSRMARLRKSLGS